MSEEVKTEEETEEEKEIYKIYEKARNKVYAFLDEMDEADIDTFTVFIAMLDTISDTVDEEKMTKLIDAVIYEL